MSLRDINPYDLYESASKNVYPQMQAEWEAFSNSPKDLLTHDIFAKTVYLVDQFVNVDTIDDEYWQSITNFFNQQSPYASSTPEIMYNVAKFAKNGVNFVEWAMENFSIDSQELHDAIQPFKERNAQFDKGESEEPV